ncbi:MAG: HAMP domain-containing histidine kinase, partial [Ilumatobacter sp.]|nr:HAMP domain-containing histidine kinase [Ilumatobacter sp.]
MASERHRPGLRLRITAVAGTIVAAALAVGAIALIGLLRARLDDAATTAARLRARDVAALATSGSLPRTLALPGEESAVVQVLAGRSTVVAASENIDGEPPISTLHPPAGEELVVTVPVAALDPHGSMRLIVISANSPTGPVVVLAGESLAHADATVDAIVTVLLVTIPAIVLLVIALAWWAVGRTLRPVDRISSALADITATDLHRRVPAQRTVDEIGRLAATVNDTLERLDTAVERQRRFVADASHELRGPLTALRADLELSLRHPARTDWHAVAGEALADVVRLQFLSEDLLALARLGATGAERSIHTVDLAELVRDEIEHLAPGGLRIVQRAAGQHAIVTGSSHQLRRLIRNLLQNATQHARSGITVDLTGTAQRVTLQVADDGPGISPADRAMAVQPFVRLDEARTRDTGGTGLGLAIVDEIVRTHGGVLALDESPEGGLLVSVELPAAPG